MTTKADIVIENVAHANAIQVLEKCLEDDWPLAGNWTQGAYARRESDQASVVHDDVEAGLWCTLGRIGWASDQLGLDLDTASLAMFTTALKSSDSPGLTAWNDSDERDAQDVHDAFVGTIAHIRSGGSI